MILNNNYYYKIIANILYNFVISFNCFSITLFYSFLEQENFLLLKKQINHHRPKEMSLDLYALWVFNSIVLYIKTKRLYKYQF